MKVFSGMSKQVKAKKSHFNRHFFLELDAISVDLFKKDVTITLDVLDTATMFQTQQVVSLSL